MKGCNRSAISWAISPTDEAHVDPEAKSKHRVFPQNVEGKSNSFCSSCSESRRVIVLQAREEEKVKDYD